MFRSTHIRTKLAVALAVPLSALVVVGGLEVLDAKAQVDKAESQAELASASIGPGSVVVHLQEERNRAYIDLVGVGDAAPLTTSTRAELRARTDKAANEFRQETTSRGEVVQAAFQPAWAAIVGLDQIRGDIDAYAGPKDTQSGGFADQVFERYTDIVDSFFEGSSRVALTVDDASLRNGASIVDASTRQSEYRTRIVRTIVEATVAGELADGAVTQQVAALYDRTQQLDQAIRIDATGPYSGVADATFSETAIQGFNLEVDAFLAGDDARLAPLLTALAFDDTTGYSGLRARAAAILSAEATKMQDDAIARQTLFGGIALGGLVLTLLITWLASRSITRPLRSLKAQAEEMAESRLPTAVRQILDTPSGEDVVIPEVPPIAVKTRDEVAGVAAALSKVQSSALELAVEQAVLRRNISDSYINLGRRNQGLLSRQLDFITELERNEADPDTLEGLFRLDHLATRMRRNAESLLVLAGIDPPRQWAAPVQAVDVVRAALGEVEDYNRVVVAHLEPASITGAVAAEIAHVLAELVENALTFSPPDQSVEVKGRLSVTGYAITVSDSGLGMSVSDLERANRRLAGQESFTVAPSRYLGHYVAGHLASRLGIVVELKPSPTGGVLAEMTVPMGLVADDELDAQLAKARQPESQGAPVTSGPAHSAAPTERTANGLPRRGERTPSAAEVDQAAGAEPEAPAPVAQPMPVPDPVPEPMPELMPQPVAADVNESATLTALPVVQGPSLFSVTAAEHARHTGVPANGHASPNGGGFGMGAPSEQGSVATVAPNGLVRRVPGAQRPDAPVSARTEAPVATEATRTTPEDVYSFLSSFQSGVARGRADATGDTPAQSQEDGR